MPAASITVPGVGESITEGILSKWLKPDGSAVKAADPLFELETARAGNVAPASASGVLKVDVAEGTTVAIGATVGSIAPEGQPAAATATAAATGKAAKDAQAPAAASKPAPAASNGGTTDAL